MNSQPLLQRRHPDGQPTHEKMLNILIIKEIQVKTTMRCNLTPVRMANINNLGNNRCWWGCGDRGSLLHCWWECKLVQPLWKTVWRFLKKLKIELPHDPAIALLGIYPRDTGVLFRRDTCTPMFIAALSTIAKVWKEPKCPSTDEWIKKMWCIYIYNGVLLGNQKNEILPFATTWMELEDIMLHEISQSEKKKNHMTSLIWGL